jgi:hypothetical protein
MIPEGIQVPGERKKPWGTAHAVLVTAAKIDEPFAAINADDFYGSGAFKAMFDFLSVVDDEDTGSYCMVGYELRKTLSEFGHVSRGVCETDSAGLLTGITERTHIEQTDEGICYLDENGVRATLSGDETVSMNMWGFTQSVFDHFQRHFGLFLKDHADDPKAEFYIPTAVNDLMRAGDVTVKVLRSADDWFGITYKDDKAAVESKIRQLINDGRYPDNLWK